MTKKRFSFLKWGITCTTPSTYSISITMCTCPIGDHLSSRHSSNWWNIISWYILTRANSLVTLRFPYQCIHVALERICTCPKQVLSTFHIDSIWIKTLLNHLSPWKPLQAWAYIGMLPNLEPTPTYMVKKESTCNTYQTNGCNKRYVHQ